MADDLVIFTPKRLLSFSGFWEIFANNAFRIGVDLFLMLSGALSLGREWKIRDFLGKRLPRIIKPFIFWSIIGSLTFIGLTYYIPEIVFIESFTPLSILTAIGNTFLAKSHGFGSYWFFWMILGTYLIMPIINKWLLHSKLQEAEYFLVLWVINTIFDYTLMIKCPVKLSYFTSPIGMVVLGYYLRHTKRSIFNNKYIAFLLAVTPMLVMVAYSYSVLDLSHSVTSSKEFLRFNRYSILCLIEVTGIFCLFKTSSLLKNPNSYFKKLVMAIATCSYGMYLTHALFIYFLGKAVLPDLGLGFFANYIILLVVGFFGSLLLIYSLGKVPIVRNYIGIK